MLASYSIRTNISILRLLKTISKYLNKQTYCQGKTTEISCKKDVRVISKIRTYVPTHLIRESKPYMNHHLTTDLCNCELHQDDPCISFQFHQVFLEITGGSQTAPNIQCIFAPYQPATTNLVIKTVLKTIKPEH